MDLTTAIAVLDDPDAHTPEEVDEATRVTIADTAQQNLPGPDDGPQPEQPEMGDVQ